MFDSTASAHGNQNKIKSPCNATHSRIDGLARRVEHGTSELEDVFSGREDRLQYRGVQYAPPAGSAVQQQQQLGREGSATGSGEGGASGPASDRCRLPFFVCFSFNCHRCVCLWPWYSARFATA